MKLIKNIFILVLLFSFSVNITHAISGACSYHNGVNCDAGPSYGGKVICNDGWINSSVDYRDAIECKSNYDPCYSSSPASYLKTMSSIGGSPCISWETYNMYLENERNYYNQTQTLRMRQGLVSMGPFDENKNSKLLNCKSEIQTYEKIKQAYQDCLNNQTNTRRIEFERTQELNCLSLYGLNSVYSDGKCVCAEGYILDNNSNQCKLCPSNSKYNNGKCICLDGYVFSNNQCLEWNKICSSMGINSQVLVVSVDPLTRVPTLGCECKPGFSLSLSGVCEAEVKEIKMISKRAKIIVDNSLGKCENVGLSSEEILECLAYKNYPEKYIWEVYDGQQTPVVTTQPKTEEIKKENILPIKEISKPIKESLDIKIEKTETINLKDKATTTNIENDKILKTQDLYGDYNLKSTSSLPIKTDKPKLGFWSWIKSWFGF